MKTAWFIPSIVVFSLLSACSAVNSDFSCKATAGDSCLTIEEVDAMTRFADDVPVYNRFKKTSNKADFKKPSLNLVENKTVLWVASPNFGEG